MTKKYRGGWGSPAPLWAFGLVLAALLASSLLLGGCDRGKDPPPPTHVAQPASAAAPAAAAAVPAAPTLDLSQSDLQPPPLSMEAPPKTPPPSPAGIAPVGSGLGEVAGPAKAAPPPAAAAPAKTDDLPLPAVILAGRAFGLASPAGPILPEDRSIGALQDWRSGDRETRSALQAARVFLDGVLAGRLNEASVDAEKAFLVAVLAAPLLETPHAIAYRIGKMEMSGTETDRSALARVELAWPVAGQPAAARVFSKEGELGLRMSGGLWYVESINLSPVAAGGEGAKASAP